MTLTPLTDRKYAYFHVSGPGTHEAITERIGLEPTEAWNVGENNPRTGQPRTHMSWRLSSGLDDTAPLSEHIEVLFLFLHVKADALRSLWLDHDLTLHCVGYFPPSGHSMHFDREQIRRAAQLGLAFDLDFYYVDDHEHEV